jgi:hypothetical protein
MAKMIDLGREDSCCAPACCEPTKPEKRIYYPTLYIDGVSFPTGEFTATIKGRVIGCREPSNGKASCEIEVHSISEPSGKSGGLEAALDNISKKKNEDDE